MVVNPGYQKLALPVSVWPLEDTFTTLDVSLYTGCISPDQYKDYPLVPIGPQVSAPVASLDITSQHAVYANATARTHCSVVTGPGGDVLAVTLNAVGRQTPGTRFMISVTSVADAEFLQLHTAALQTTASVSNVDAQFSDATGRNFVGPTPDSMRAAMATATFDPASATWVLPYATLRASGGVAYPGTMPVFASVPTSDLPVTDAAHLAQFLRFAAGEGQQQGFGNGQLPPGYLPLTAQNGLASLVNYTKLAADAVAAQKGEVVGIPAPPPATPTGSPPLTVVPANTPPALPAASGQQAPAPAPAPVSVAQVPPGNQTPVAAPSRGFTADLFSSLAGWGLPVALIVCVAAAVLGGGTRLGFSVAGAVRARR
jgi:hypothetical protein